MPRTAIAPVSPQKGAQLGVVSAGDLDVTMNATDVANGNSVSWASDRLLVIAWNSTAGATTITFTSLADTNGRVGTITSYSLAADDHIVAIFARDGWQQTDAQLYIDASDAGIKVAILKL